MAISPGLRQKHAGSMLRVIDRMEQQLTTLRKRVTMFDEDCEVIPAVVVELLERDMLSLVYYAGQANGALTMHDVPDST